MIDSLNKIKFEQFGSSYSKLQLIPTIDISKGRAVLVNKGNVVTEHGDPFQRAKELSINNDFQIVDIDAAKGNGNNRELIKKISNKYHCYIAGGVRTKEIALEYLNQNAKRVVISTSVINSNLIEEIPINRLIIALDIDNDYNLLLRGRTEQTKINLFDIILQKKKYLNVLTITFHDTEGTGKGIDMNKVKIIKNFLEKNDMKTRLVIAGGIKSIEEVKNLLDMNVSPQFGFALWTKLFTLGDLYSNIMDYSKLEKFQSKEIPILVPCIIMRKDGLPLSLAYSDKSGIKETVDGGKLIIYSRSKNKKWIKGSESGNEQKLVQVSFNCDRTSLLYIVDGGNYCSKDAKSCFNYRNPSKGGMEYLEEIIKEAFDDEKKLNELEFQVKLMTNKKWLICKVLEEVNELQVNPNILQENEINTISDLIYLLTLYCVSCNIPVSEIFNELTRRHFTLSKPKYEINPIPKEFKLGICLNQIDEKDGFDFLIKQGIFLEKDISEGRGKRSMKYNAKFLKDENFKICAFLIKPKDVFRFFDYGYCDGVICYKDILENHPLIYEQINFPNEEEKKKCPFLYQKISVIANKDFDIELIKKNNKRLYLYTEYIHLTNDWVKKNNLNIKVIDVSGETLQFLVNELCDLVVCISDEKDIKENNLKIIEEICVTELGFFSNSKYAETLKNLISV